MGIAVGGYCWDNTLVANPYQPSFRGELKLTLSGRAGQGLTIEPDNLGQTTLPCSMFTCDKHDFAIMDTLVPT